tara:strand:- start:1892 stop:2218 length:327 start_codon:yes stop_codon:yes gene_type:complete
MKLTNKGMMLDEKESFRIRSLNYINFIQTHRELISDLVFQAKHFMFGAIYCPESDIMNANYFGTYLISKENAHANGIKYLDCLGCSACMFGKKYNSLTDEEKLLVIEM